jgi:hypothetical protein
MWDFSMMTSSSEGAGIAAPGSTCHLEISLAAMRPSCSKEDRISSFMLQESQFPPEVSGMADSVSEDCALGDDVALMAALKRENTMGANEG